VIYEYEPHFVTKIKNIPWGVCNKCGLVYLSNIFTKWSIKKGCNSEDHPEYNKFRNGGVKYE
jgi:hypothetical protein